MKPQEFENDLRRFCRQEPFRPFVVELTSGERIEVFDPEGLAVSGPAASYDSGSEMYNFDCGEVMRIAELPQKEIRVMGREHWEAELRRLIWQQPFRPFVVELTSGERVEAVHPDAVGFGGGNASVIKPGGVPVLFRLADVARIVERTDARAAHAT